MKSAVAVSDLVVEYTTSRGRIRALDSAALLVGFGETVSVVGESGSGKSTLGLSIGKILPTSARRLSGDVRVNGVSVFDLGTDSLRALRRESLGFIFQNPIAALDPTMRIRDQMRAVAPSERLADLFNLVGLKDALRVGRSYPHELSGGMAQRVMIAMALARQPRIIIADEPTASLDSTAKATVLDILFQRARETSATVLLLTHDLRSVSRYCDKVAVMYAGRTVEFGSTRLLFSQPQHPYTRALMAAAPGAEHAQGTLRPIPGTPPVLRGTSPGCAFADRCHLAIARCRIERPELRLVGGLRVACHLAPTGQRSITETKSWG